MASWALRYRGQESALVLRRTPAIAGAAAGVLPDADALIQSGADALLVLDCHRHFTHALAFVPSGAMVAVSGPNAAKAEVPALLFGDLGLSVNIP